MPGILHPCQDLLQRGQTAALCLPVQKSTVNKGNLLAIGMPVASKRAPLPDDEQWRWLVLPLSDTQHPRRVVQQWLYVPGVVRFQVAVSSTLPLYHAASA